MATCMSMSGMWRLDSAMGQTLASGLVESLGNLRAMGQRSWLALLGILVGSASIVALLNIGRSATEDAMSAFRGLGTDTLVASFPERAGRSVPLPKTLDTRPLQWSLPELAHIAPLSQYATRVSRAGLEFDASVIGTTTALANVMGLKLASGRFISAPDRNGLFVVLGAEVATGLAEAGRPVREGDSVRIGHYQFQVIGVLAPTPHNPLLPVAIDPSAFMPASSLARLSSQIRMTHVIATVRPQVALSQAASSLEVQLSQHLAGREVAVQVPRQLLDSLKRQSETFAWLLAGLGGISLLVAGVGVMNVTLMSVRERRREIGVRMALGARPRDIGTMFLLEAVFLSVLGALLGALAGCLIACVFCASSGWPLNLSFDALLLGVGSSLSSGLFFGSYPATLAARLSPAMALRDD